MLDRSVFLRPIAHRGLHDAAKGVIENTPPAFAAALDRGYGIECDLQPASGGEPVVFHDPTLGRLTEVESAVISLEPALLKAVAFKGTGARIPTFAELLEQVAGRVPLVVEIKADALPERRPFCERIAALALAYRGPIALKSFDPYVMIEMRKLAPGLPLGLVSGGWRGPAWHEDTFSPVQRFALRHLLLAPRFGPDFISYDVRALPAPAPSFYRSVGRPLFAWTVRSSTDRERAARYADAIVFEGFLP
jgi:glycerophosphoryl diester phosphodiesterase